MTQKEKASASVWVITKQGQLHKVNSKGNIDHINGLDSVSNVSCGADRTLWILPLNNNSDNNQLWFSENGGKEWKKIDLPNLSCSGIAATHLGSCFLLTPQGSVYLVQKSGDIQKVFAEGTANDLAISPEGFIWLISRQKKPGGGNLVYWCTYGNYVLQPAFGQPVAKKVSAGPDGTARIITMGGEVASLYPNRMGGIETPGGKVFARNIAASKASNTIWVISHDISKDKKRNVLKCWNPDIDPYLKWEVIEGIEPFFISGGD